MNYVSTHTYDDQTLRPALSGAEVWLLPDPAMQFSNPYLAMGNNPVMYVDPDGEFIIEAMMIGSMIGAMTAGFSGASNGQILASAGIGAIAGAASAGAGSLVSGAGFAAGAAKGALVGFSGGFVNGSGNAWVSGADFGAGVIAGFKGGAIGAVSGAVIGGLSGGFAAKKNGMDFWTGDFRSEERAINFFMDALASTEKTSILGYPPRIDLGSSEVSEQYRMLFKYLNDYGASGYSIDELVDLTTKFDKSWIQEFADDFFDGGFQAKTLVKNIEFSSPKLAGQIKMAYWSDRSLISGGFRYQHYGKWHMLRLESTRGSYMLELGLNSKDLFNHYVYKYIPMNLHNIKR